MWGRRKSPSAVRREVRRKAGKVGLGQIMDFADVHGTELAQALYRLRKHPDSVEAMQEALRQYEVLGALLEELKLRQAALV